MKINQSPKSKRAYDIYFHKDFDGVSGAVVFSDFLLSKEMAVKINYFPVDFSIENEWLNKKFKNPAVVIDFLYHPKAEFWFDHHPTSFLNENLKRKFQPEKHKVWRPKYRSATHLVFDSLVHNFHYQPSPHVKNLVHWADVIDSAHFHSPWQTILIKEPAIQLAEVIDRWSESKNKLIFLIKNLIEFPVKKIVRFKKIKEEVGKIKKENEKAVIFFEKKLEIFSHKVAFIDLSKSKLPLLRFLPYYLEPQLDYAMLVEKEASLFHLHLSYNPWKTKNSKIHLGNLARKYNGGGHRNAAGLEIKNREKMNEISLKIINYLLKNG